MKKILITTFLITASLAVIAKPAYRGPITRIAEDGTETTVYLHGDEYFHYSRNLNSRHRRKLIDMVHAQ